MATAEMCYPSKSLSGMHRSGSVVRDTTCAQTHVRLDKKVRSHLNRELSRRRSDSRLLVTEANSVSLKRHERKLCVTKRLGLVPQEDAPPCPQRLCRAILPALFPAWASPRCTIRQRRSAFADPSLQECAHSWTERTQSLLSCNQGCGRVTRAISALRFAARCARQVPLTARSHMGYRTPQQVPAMTAALVLPVSGTFSGLGRVVYLSIAIAALQNNPVLTQVCPGCSLRKGAGARRSANLAQHQSVLMQA